MDATTPNIVGPNGDYTHFGLCPAQNDVMSAIKAGILWLM